MPPCTALPCSSAGDARCAHRMRTAPRNSQTSDPCFVSSRAIRQANDVALTRPQEDRRKDRQRRKDLLEFIPPPRRRAPGSTPVSHRQICTTFRSAVTDASVDHRPDHAQLPLYLRNQQPLGVLQQNRRSLNLPSRRRPRCRQSAQLGSVLLRQYQRRTPALPLHESSKKWISMTNIMDYCVSALLERSTRWERGENGFLRILR